MNPISIFEDNLGNKCFMVVDTVVHGIAAGGIRISESVSLEEVKALAQAMSYKFAMFDIEMGGAKVGIRLKDGNDKGSAMLNFKKYLQPLINRLNYIPGVDLGSDEHDIDALYRRVWWRRIKIDSSYFTAIGIGACLDFIAQRYSLKKMRITLSGFGKVGYFLLKELIHSNAEVVAISNKYGYIHSDSGLDKQKLITLKDNYSDEWIFHYGLEIFPKDKVYAVTSDIIIPAAEAYAINSQNLELLDTKFICPIANIPYQNGTAAKLSSKGIVCFPDFVTSVGGVLSHYFYSQGCPFSDIEKNVRSRIFSMLDYLYKNSGDDYYSYALKYAQNKIQKNNKIENNRNGKLTPKLKAKIFLSGYIPKWLIKKYYKLAGK